MNQHIFPHLVRIASDVSDQSPVLMYVASLHCIFFSLRVVGYHRARTAVTRRGFGSVWGVSIWIGMVSKLSRVNGEGSSQDGAANARASNVAKVSFLILRDLAYLKRDQYRVSLHGNGQSTLFSPHLN